jgi:hypothetical protein
MMVKSIWDVSHLTRWHSSKPSMSGRSTSMMRMSGGSASHWKITSPPLDTDCTWKPASSSNRLSTRRLAHCGSANKIRCTPRFFVPNLSYLPSIRRRPTLRLPVRTPRVSCLTRRPEWGIHFTRFFAGSRSVPEVTGTTASCLRCGQERKSIFDWMFARQYGRKCRFPNGIVAKRPADANLPRDLRRRSLRSNFLPLLLPVTSTTRKKREISHQTKA